MTSLSDFKHSLFLVVWVTLPESQTAPFRSPDPKESPCLGQDESQLIVLQNAWEAACPVIRVAPEGNSSRWQGSLRLCGWKPLPTYDPYLLQGKVLHVLKIFSRQQPHFLAAADPCPPSELMMTQNLYREWWRKTAWVRGSPLFTRKGEFPLGRV